jgi:hypothetical protein
MQLPLRIFFRSTRRLKERLMKVRLPNISPKGITLLILFLVGTISLTAGVLSTSNRYFSGPLIDGSVFTDFFRPSIFNGTSRAAIAPTVSTDKLDYRPGETVIISGSGFGGDTSVTLQVTHIGAVDSAAYFGAHDPWDVPVTNGSFSAVWVVDEDSVGATLLLTAVGSPSGAAASTTFTDSAAANIDQCRNGSATSPNDCLDLGGGTGWVNGNVGSSQGHMVEGYSIPYRVIMTDLPVGHPITIDLGYDITHSSKHAIDYLTHFNRLEPHFPFFGHPAEAINPISGVSGVSGTVTTVAITAPSSAGSPVAGQPGTSFSLLPAGEKVMTLYGGNVTGFAYVSQGSLTDAQSETVVRITLTPDSATAVLAWGGHIARGDEWNGASAGAISGSPYHMRLKDWQCLDLTGHDCPLGNLGNQDRSLSAAVVIPIPPQGSIQISKDAIPDDPQDFTYTASTVQTTTIPNFSLDDDGLAGGDVACTGGNCLRTQTFPGLKAGVYTITESNANSLGWKLTDLQCPTLTDASVDIHKTGGEAFVVITLNTDQTSSVACTFTNTKTPRLKLVKTVTNDNGGTAVANDWDLTATGTGGFTELTPAAANATFRDVNVGVGYALSETGPANYTAGSFGCDGGSQVGNVVTLAAGDSVTCTINNDDIPPQLHLRKIVTNDNGGTATVADFPLTANGTGANDLTGTSPVDSGPGLLADTWTLSETGPAGYSNAGYVCVGGTQVGQTIQVGIGGSATCTITNNDIPPQLHLRKIVTNNNGGTATVADFPLTADGTGANDLTGTSPVDSGAGLLADTWTLSETGPAGYSNAGYVCVGGTQVGQTIQVGIGGSATCTITNNDIPPQLHLRKIVTNNNGGTATVADFPLTANGTGANDLTGTSPVDSGAGLQADTWALSETGPAGYSNNGYVCVGGTQVGQTIQVGIGGSATCTITNNDIPPQLHLRKVVVNDNGGTATVADFPLTADGAGANDLTGTSPVDSGPGLQADTWTLSETGPAGYSNAGYVCVGGTQVGQTIQVGIGGSATCTITNDDIPPQLHLRKIVTNNNGGTATVADFPLTANGTGANDLTGTSPVDSGPGLLADTWTLSETGPAGYSNAGYVCVGGTQVGQTIQVGIGGSATCTITNDDIPPQLHLRKIVTNNNGGTATVADFPLTANGTGANDLTGTSPVDSGAGLQADTWALSETGPAGYSNNGYVCVGGTQVGQTIQVGIGGSATCTITNNDIPPQLHLRKVVVNDNGGTATVADFPLTADGTGANDLTGTSPVDSGPGLQADTWALSETGPAGYSNAGYVCVGGVQLGQSITVGIGGSATCTITNDDRPGTIIIRKFTNPAQSPTQFTFTTTGSGYAGFSINGVTGTNTNSQTLNAGNYSAKELVPLGWALTGVGINGQSGTACAVSSNGGQGPGTSTGSGATFGTDQTAQIVLKNGDTVTCDFDNTGQGVTRTQGFWATHTPLANIAWFGGTAFGHTFPGVTVAGLDTTIATGCATGQHQIVDPGGLGKLMGGFWSDISKKSTGPKRSPTDQGRMQLLQQLLAAELNFSAFGSVPSGGVSKFTDWENAFCSGNVQTALQEAGSFNTQGDNGTFTPGTSADSKYARAVANRPFWDILP